MAEQPRLSRSMEFRFQSLEEARAFYGGRYEMERTERHTPFEASVELASVGPIAISRLWCRSGLHCWTEELEDVFSLVIPLTRGGAGIHGRVPVSLSERRSGMISSPHRGGGCHLEPDAQQMNVIIPHASVMTAFTSLTGKEGRAPVQFEPQVSLTSGAGASSMRLAQFLLEEARGDDSSLASPLIAARFADALLFGLLEGQPHNYTAALASPPRVAEPRYVRAAAEYLDAHAAEPISIAGLATVTGVSLRSINEGFRRHRGCSPLEFLRERRLELCRTRLLSAPDSKVSEIAMGSGFTHLGRFSAAYRARFGEGPAETQRRARRERGGLVGGQFQATIPISSNVSGWAVQGALDNGKI